MKHVEEESPQGDGLPEGSTLPSWVETLTALLDDRFRIPFTDIRFGLDALLGMVPVIGDSATAISSISILLVAYKHDVSTNILFKMIGNIVADFLLGSVPVVGDATDVLFRANRRNLNLLKAHRTKSYTKSTLGKTLLVTLGIFMAVLGMVLPIVLLALLLRQ